MNRKKSGERGVCRGSLKRNPELIGICKGQTSRARECEAVADRLTASGSGREERQTAPHTETLGAERTEAASLGGHYLGEENHSGFSLRVGYTNYTTRRVEGLIGPSRIRSGKATRGIPFLPARSEGRL